MNTVQELGWHPDEAYDDAALAREEAAEVVTEVEALDRLRAAIRTVGSQRTWARRNGVGENLLSDVLAGRKRLPPVILRALGLSRAIVGGRS
ncbi:hypothetical protein ACLBXO_16340 [Methylobacterium sp. C33D]